MEGGGSGLNGSWGLALQLVALVIPDSWRVGFSWIIEMPIMR